ncbi:hypothetical protein [Trinickia sp.]|uniref:hypothetical protein n=1 Tax=Trinickia sp. TaxID=2571163 RepID=UPI003F8103E2
MSNKHAPDQPGKQSPQPSSEENKNSGGTFKTDVSETDSEGTTVREAEVREDDLTEVDRNKDQKHS